MAKRMLDKQKWGWWRSAVFYQIYPKSFQDTTGSGVGDLRGIISRLDYLEELGIDGIWLSPVCESPQVDNGYDISDYCAVDPMFGTMEDMQTLITEAKKRGISIIVDLVLNHSSDQHRWFREALKSRDNPYHDYYVWRDGDASRPPNEMRAVFGGSAWTWVPHLGQWYLHQFAEQQPDLNWENPAMRRELYGFIRFWVDLGVEGFRLDVIDQIAKDPELQVTNNGPRLHEFLRELSAEAFREEGLVSVGEAWGADTERAKLYSAPDASEMSMVFQFEHICLDQEPGKDKWDVIPLSLPKLKDCFRRWQEELHGKGWNSLFFNNHDLPRIVSRWGNDGEYRVESAKMLATMLHGMEGTPYIFQGEELGMTNIRLELEDHVDIETLNVYRERVAQGYDPEDVMASIRARSRDNARTPMQWTAGENAGFTTGTPWIPVNPNHSFINAEAALADPDSVFHHYQKLIGLRKTYDVFRDGSFSLLCPDDEKIFAYTRDTEHEHLLVVCNFTGESLYFDAPANFRGAKQILSNYATEAPELRPYEAVMLWYNDLERNENR
ncbi:MAG: alpha-glucosidase [Oscillospiraceae bacterium]|nr:alpha-glucosidase [Oscillospiraceae bacterium]